MSEKRASDKIVFKAMNIVALRLENQALESQATAARKLELESSKWNCGVPAILHLAMFLQMSRHMAKDMQIDRCTCHTRRVPLRSCPHYRSCV